MRNVLIRVPVVLLLVAIIISMPILSTAQTNDNSLIADNGDRFTTISSVSGSIVKSGITVTCRAKLKAKYSTSLKIVMVLQKDTSSGWTNVKTWTTTGTGTNLDIEESRAINILYTYRLKVTYTADSENYTTYYYY